MQRYAPASSAEATGTCRSPSSRTSGGMAVLQRGAASGQRGAKGQPGAWFVGSGTVPGIVTSASLL